MLVSPQVFTAIVSALMLSVFLKIPVAVLVTVYVFRSTFGLSSPGSDIRRAVLLIGIVGSLLFHALMYFPGGMLGVMLGGVAFWFLTIYTIDNILDVDYDQSQYLAGRILLVSMLIWLTIGAVPIILSALD